MSVQQRITAQRTRSIQSDKFFPSPPLGKHRILSLRRHEGCEALVEPEIIPPLHSHQVSEPLMAHFVSDDLGHQLLDPNTAVLVDEQGDLPERDRSPVFHRASRKLWHRDQVKFRKNILYSEIFLEELYGLFCHVKREFRAGRFPRDRRNCVLDAVVFLFHLLELAYS